MNEINEQGKEVDSDSTEGALVVQDGTLSEKFVEAASKQIELRARLLGTALKALKPHDIQDFDGKPYIEGEGAARIMAVIRGFKVGEAKFVVEQIHPHYFIECQIPIEFMGATTVALGDCSTADSFFSGKDGNGGRYAKYREQTGSETMASRLLLGDAKKKARENALSRGVSELLGLKGLKWDDLEKLGFSRTGAGSSVSFKKGSQGGTVGTVSVSDAVGLAVGSKANIKGGYVDIQQKSPSGKDLTLVKIKDEKSEIVIQQWGKLELDVVPGGAIFCEEVIVSEYKGTRQYTAKKIDIVPEEVSPSDPASNGA